MFVTKERHAAGCASSSVKNSWNAKRPTLATESRLVKPNAEIARRINVCANPCGNPILTTKEEIALANTTGGVSNGRTPSLATAPTAINAMIAKKLSNNIAPKDTGSIAFSVLICLLAVPEDTKEWNPDTAPHAIVTNNVGNK